MKTHPLNVSYLVVGLVFLGIAGSWALRQTGVVDLGEVRWLLPLTLVVAGAVGLVAFAAKGIGARSRTSDRGDYPTSTDSDTDLDIRTDTDTEGDLR